MEKMTNENIPVMGTSRAVELISRLFTASAARGIAPKDWKVPFLSGAPGVGKTAAVRQIADNLAAALDRPVRVTTIELQFSTPSDLAGLPVADLDNRTAVWLLPSDFDLDPDPCVVNLLFLDELTDAMPSVLAAAKSLIQQRHVGSHVLPDNTCIITAGNRTADMAAVSKLPGPLANRFLHIGVTVDFPGWQKWAEKNDIHPAVITFLRQAPHNLCTPVSRSAFATPRTWADVSDVLKLMDAAPTDPDTADLVSGLIGVGLSAEFAAWFTCCRELPDMDAILAGTAAVPETMTSQQSYFLAIGMVQAAADADETGFGHLIDFALQHFSREYQTLLFSLLIDRDMRERLTRHASFRGWLSRNGRYLT